MSAPNGDGEKISSHIVEVGDFSHTDGWGPGIEEMYTRLAHRAEVEHSLIVNVIQSVNVMPIVEASTNLFQPRLIIVLTAQRISRDDFERQQRMAQFSQGGPRR